MVRRLRLIIAFGWNLGLAGLCYSQGYYPLHVGDRRDYGELDFGHFNFLYSVQIIGDSIMPNGVKYSVEQSIYGTAYLRQVGDTVFTYTGKGDNVLYDFSVKYGDTVSVFYTPVDTITTIVYVGQGQVFNRLRKIWTYKSIPRHGSNEGWYSIADSVGRSYLFAEGGYTEYLIGAILDGVEYGQISSIRTIRATGPASFALFQNYPNPFNPSTTIPYSLPQRAHVVLSVFNTLGRAVTILVNETEGAGNHEVRFDGGSLGTGVYFYRLSAGDYVATKRLVLIR